MDRRKLRAQSPTVAKFEFARLRSRGGDGKSGGGRVRVAEPREIISGANKMNIRRSAWARRNEDMICNEIRGGDVGLRGVEEEWGMLMRAALDGDSTAYRRLLATLTPVLRTVTRRNCARIGLDGGEAEDIVQEVLLAIHLKRHTWDVDRPFGPWIMTIARNKLIDARRRRGNRLTLPIDDLADILTAEGSDDAADRGDLDRLLGRPWGASTRFSALLVGRRTFGSRDGGALEDERGRGPRGATPRHQGARGAVSRQWR